MDAGDYLYQARADGYQDLEFVPFEPGIRDVQIVMTRIVSIAGTIRVADGVSAAALVVSVHQGEQWEPWNWSNQHHPLPSGEFLLRELAPATYDVAIRIDAESEPLHVVRDVVVAGGRVTRLDPVDLTRALRSVDFEVVGPDLAPVELGMLGFRPSSDPTARTRRVQFAEGRVSLATRHAALDLDVWAPGFRRAALPGVRTGQRIVLETGVPVRVHLDDAVELPPEPLELRLLPISRSIYRRAYDEYVYSGDGLTRRQWIQWHKVATRPFDQSRETLFHLPLEDEYVLRWQLRPTDSSHGSGEDLAAAAGQGVLDMSVEPTSAVVLAPDATSLEEALERLLGD